MSDVTNKVTSDVRSGVTSDVRSSVMSDVRSGVTSDVRSGVTSGVTSSDVTCCLEDGIGGGLTIDDSVMSDSSSSVSSEEGVLVEPLTDSSSDESTASRGFVVIDGATVSYQQSLDCNHGNAGAVGGATPRKSPVRRISPEMRSRLDSEDYDEDEPKIELMELHPLTSNPDLDVFTRQPIGAVNRAESSSEEFCVLSDSEAENQAPHTSTHNSESLNSSMDGRAAPPHVFKHLTFMRARSESSGSDHSDFVRLGSLPHMRSPALRLSTCSSSSSSLNSNLCLYDGGTYPHDLARARAASRARAETLYLKRHQDDSDSVPSDVDDRCESDISGFATDSDLSSVSIGDLPLTAGNVRRSYRHRPNVLLNSALTTVALVSVFLVIGVGIGHYIGCIQEGKLRNRQVANLRSLQDDYIMCLQRQEKLQARLKTPSTREEQLSAVVSIWQEKYEELVVEKAALEGQLRDLQTQLTSDLEHATQHILTQQVNLAAIGKDLKFLQLETKEADNDEDGVELLEDATEDELENNLTLGGYDTPKEESSLLERDTDVAETSEEQINVLNDNSEQRDDAMVENLGSSCQNPSEVDFQDYLSLRQQLQVLMLENQQLKSRIGRILYSKHPANQDESDKGDTFDQLPDKLELYMLLLHRTRYMLSVMIQKYRAEKQMSEHWHKLYLNATSKGNASTSDEIISLLLSQWEALKSMSLDGEFLRTLPQLLNPLTNRSEDASAENDTADHGFKQSGSTILSQVKAFLNKTQKGIARLTKKVRSTIDDVQKMSGNLNVEGYGKAAMNEVLHFGDSIASGWKKFVASIKGKEKFRRKNKNKPKKMDKPVSSDYKYLKETVHGKKDYVLHDPVHGADSMKKDGFEHKGIHKQSSEHDFEYAEFWKLAEYEPDDILHDGFFEKNNQEWRKQQKRFRKLHGRIQRLTEEMLMTMDEDDVEDIYDDLDDLQDDVEEMEAPESLMTWLTCQIRWWKSRIHRKHRSENLITGCVRNLRKWQVKALCRPVCLPWEKHCKDWLSLRGKIDALCQGHAEDVQTQGGKDRDFVELTVDGLDGRKSGVLLNDVGQMRFSVDQDGDEQAKDAERDADSGWYWRESGDVVPVWFLNRLEDMEDKRRDTSWYFHRIERDDPDSRWQFARGHPLKHNKK